MNELYIMDACALIAFLHGEPGSEVVSGLLTDVNTAEIHMNCLNLLEVYYDMYRSIGKEKADDELSLIKKLPILFHQRLTNSVFKEAGRLKAAYKISLADSIALAEASVSGGLLLTADHHEFDIVEKQERIRFKWIR